MGIQREVRIRKIAGPRLWVNKRYHNVVCMASKKKEVKKMRTLDEQLVIGCKKVRKSPPGLH